MNSHFDKFARVSALRPAMRRARLASAVTGAQEAPSRTDSRAGDGAGPLAALLGGALDRNHFGSHFVVRRWYSTPEPCPPLNGALHLLDPRAPRLAADPARWLFLDTETTGLAGGTGTYAFLVGLAWWDSAGLQLEQFFLRDFDDEHSMLTALAARLAERPVLVTFNGKSFDWPLLETRYRMTRSIPSPDPAAHLDLLHPARHIWRLRLGSVRLPELERAVLGAPSSLADWDRSHDVRSDMIPHIYFDYLRGGSPLPLLDVFRHNQMDLRGLAAIAVKLASLLDSPESADAAPLDLYGLSRLLRHRARPARPDNAGLPFTRSGAKRREGPASSLPSPATAQTCHPERRRTGRCGGSEGSAFPAFVAASQKPQQGPALGSSAPSAPSAVKESAAPALARAQLLCERALASGLPVGLDRAALRDLAALAKRQRDFSRASSLWLQLAGTQGCHPEPAAAGEESSFFPLTPSPSPLAPSLDALHACIELAIHYEHRARQPEQALHFARLALDALRPAARAGLLTPAQAARLRSRLDRRITRLQRKSGSDVSPRPSVYPERRAATRRANSASPRYLLPLPGPAHEIARTTARRASKRAPAESNGHAQIPRR